MNESQQNQFQTDNQAITWAWNTVDLAYRRLSASCACSESVFWILYGLWTFQTPMRSKEMIKFLNLPKQTLSSALGHMRQEGLVRQENARSPITLTDKGVRLCQQWIAPVHRLEEDTLKEMGMEKSQLLTQLLEEYAAIFVTLENQLQQNPQWQACSCSNDSRDDKEGNR